MALCPPFFPLPLYLPNLPKETLPIDFSDCYYAIGSEPAQELLSLLTLSRRRTLEILLTAPTANSTIDPEDMVTQYLALLSGLVADPAILLEGEEEEVRPSGEGLRQSQKAPTVPLSRGCAFTWTNFSLEHNNIGFGGVDFEICNVLLSLGLWYLMIAKELAVTKDEIKRDGNQKSAFQYYAKAAGIFQHLLETSIIRENGVPSDLKPDVYEALTKIALAEAQSITIVRNEKKQSPLLISSLCRDTSEKFADAQVLLGAANPETHTKLMAYLDFKCKFFHSKTYLYQGIDLLNPHDPAAGRAIKSIDTAIKNLEDARKVFNRFLELSPASRGQLAQEYLNETHVEMDECLRMAARENNQHYRDRISSEVDPLPDSKSNVQVVPFVSPGVDTSYWTPSVFRAISAKGDAIDGARRGHLPGISDERSGCFPFGKGVGQPKKTVAIVGGGIAGLTTAHELAEKGYNVLIYEADPVFGGKAACEEYSENLIRDHSVKNFSAYYYCLLDTLQRIPYEEDDEEPQSDSEKKKKKKKGKEKPKTVFDNLVPYDALHCLFADGRMLNVETSLTGGLMGSLRSFKALREAFGSQGVPKSNVDKYVWKHARLLFMCEQRKRKELDSISYEAYLDLNDAEKAEYRMLQNLVEVTSAVKINGSAWAASDQALKQIGKIFNPYKMKKQGNVLNGPIDKKFFNPWVKYLQKLGCKTYASKPLQRLRVDPKSPHKIAGLEFQDGTVVTADHYVLALPYSKLKYIINESNLSTQFQFAIPALDSNRGEKWGHSCHFALKDLPPGAIPTEVFAVLGSPWALIFYYITRDLWKNDPHLTDNAPVQLWITASDATTPGLLHKKPYSKCTEKEFMEEVLHQMQFKEENKHLLVSGVAGRGLDWWEAREQASFPGKVSTAKVSPFGIDVSTLVYWAPSDASKPAGDTSGIESSSEKPEEQPTEPTEPSEPASSSSSSKKEKQKEKEKEKDKKKKKTKKGKFEEVELEEQSGRDSEDSPTVYPKIEIEKPKKTVVESPRAYYEAPPPFEHLLTEQVLKDGPPIHGERVNEVDNFTQIICQAPLYAREIGMPELETTTIFHNLFLAGECIRTRQKVSTMEKANESGKRCAAQICTRDNKSYPSSRYDYHPLPLRFIRIIDAFFFHIFG